MNVSDIKKGAAVIKEIWEFLNSTEVKDLLNDIIEKTEHKLTFDEYCRMLSKSIDEIILKVQREKNFTCYGGEINFKIDNDSKYICFSVDMYFQDKDKQWYKQTQGGTTRLSKFHESAAAKINEIKENGGYSMEIEPPQ